MRIKEFVAACRKRSGKQPDSEVTHQAFADELGVTRGTVTAWENGNQSPTVANLELMAKMAGTDLNECLDLPERDAHKDENEKAIKVLRAGLKEDLTRQLVLDLAVTVRNLLDILRRRSRRKPPEDSARRA